MNKNKMCWIITIVIMVILSLAAYIKSNNVFASIEYNDVQIQNIENESIIENKHSINPKIELLSNYIKTRKSSTPKELCDKIAYEIITQSDLNQIADEIVVGIIEIESMWNVYSKSKAGARGLMQILLEDGIEIDSKQAFDISYNIEKGIAIFKSKMKKSKGDITLALKYYVGGDPEYHKAVYKYLGKYTLYKINNSNSEFFKKIKLNLNEG